ncbi:MAG: hypothetical protein KDA45_03190 [Planctomycetales bacterium]|nr:hypothetical protein [Planctomycetales bacterium]
MPRSSLSAILTLLWLACLGNPLFGQPSTAGGTTPTAAAAGPPLQVEFGLGNHWKLGHICPLRLSLSGDLAATAAEIEVESLDGDGVPLIYRMPITGEMTAADGSFWLPIRIGRDDAQLVIRVLLADGTTGYEQEYDARSAGTGLPSAQPFILAIGSAMGVDALSRTSTDGSRSTFTTVVLDSAAALPISWRDYSSCDLILFSTADSELLASLSAAQWAAIEAWIRRGGGAIISLGEQAPELSQLAPFTALLPGEIQGTGRINNPAALESLVVTEEPLAGFPCSRLQLQRGRPELTMGDALAREVPWWVSYAQGHGTLRFIASDLGHPAFENWKGRNLLWQRLLTPYIHRVASEGSEESQVGAVSYLGYGDLVGQLRATLDLFPHVRVVTFGQVAAFLVGVLLLLGPVDYLVSVKWLKRPDLSWYFAGSLLLLICGLLTWLYSAIRPSEVHVNTVQIIDVDADTGAVGGRLWSHVYSGAARRLNIHAASQVSQAAVWLDWQGLPGRGLGGLQSQLHTDRGMPTYSLDIEPRGQTRLRAVGIPAAGTKCLFASWVDTLPTPPAASSLREIPGVDQLEGELVNPLPVDLLEPMLFYHNWYYGLNSRIPAGQSAAISFDTIPKDLSRRLNGRRTIDGKENIPKWDPENRHAIDRLLELMMFYQAAAGRTYTSLTHRYQPQVDHSNLLDLDRAILVGRVEQPWAKIVVSASEAEAAPLEARQDLERVWCRIAIPVRKNTTK